MYYILCASYVSPRLFSPYCITKLKKCLLGMIPTIYFTIISSEVRSEDGTHEVEFSNDRLSDAYNL